MTKIHVRAINANTYQVTIDSASTTTHEVTVQSSYAQQLTQKKVSTDVLVEKSFEFLLQREPNTSILRRFDLSVIAHYFPEYEQEIIKRL